MMPLFDSSAISLFSPKTEVKGDDFCSAPDAPGQKRKLFAGFSARPAPTSQTPDNPVSAVVPFPAQLGQY